MADKAKLQGSFGSLLDTLTNRFDPLRPAKVVAKWTALMARCASSARANEAWDALAANSRSYDATIHSMDDASHALVVADDGDEAGVLSALDEAADAVSGLEAILGAG